MGHFKRHLKRYFLMPFFNHSAIAQSLESKTDNTRTRLSQQTGMLIPQFRTWGLNT